MVLCREERVEVAGALGKAQVLNKELSALEQELGAAHRAGTADAFLLYLYGVILSDRRVACLSGGCRSQNDGAGSSCVATMSYEEHMFAGSARLMRWQRWWPQSTLTHATGAPGRSVDCYGTHLAVRFSHRVRINNRADARNITWLHRRWRSYVAKRMGSGIWSCRSTGCVTSFWRTYASRCSTMRRASVDYR